jgi:hypothetical protein
MTANNTLVINMPAIGMLAIYMLAIMQSFLVGLLFFNLRVLWP